MQYGTISYEAMKLLPSEASLYALIENRTHNPYKYCFTPVPDFEEFFGVSERTIQRWLKKLVDKKLISIEYENGKVNKIRVTEMSPPTEMSPHPRQICHPTPDKNVTHRNKYRNTYSISIEKGSEKGSFEIPSIDEIISYAQERGFDSISAQSIAKRFFDYYDAANWYDAQGRKVKSWKQRFLRWEANEKSRQPLPEPKKPVYYTEDDDDAIDYLKY